MDTLKPILDSSSRIDSLGTRATVQPSCTSYSEPDREKRTQQSGGGLTVFASSDQVQNLKCMMIAQYCGFPVNLSSEIPADIVSLPAIRVKDTVIFGANRVCAYLCMKGKPQEFKNSGGSLPEELNDFLDAEEFVIGRFLMGNVSSSTSEQSISSALGMYEELLASDKYSVFLQTFLQVVTSVTLIFASSKFERFSSLKDLKVLYPKAVEAMECVMKSKEYSIALESVSKVVIANKKKTAPSQVDIVIPDIIPIIDVQESDGVLGMLKAIFTNAIRKAFPQSIPLGLDLAIIARCGNSLNGDYQCNNAMALTKALKGIANYKGPVTPKDTAQLIAAAVEYPSLLVESTTTAPNGFVNIFVSRSAVLAHMKRVLTEGTRTTVAAPTPRRVLVDFSSPNIAKEMHVGHLRSTIIGDAICRILEFCGHDVARVNHVGDWGTQFGMLITYLQDAYPDFLTNPPNISDLTLIYKASKKRFDEEPLFKERARSNVVNLQSGDAGCRAIWTLLCDISRKEFQKVYDILQVDLREVGESFYNPMIPATIEELQNKGLVVEEEGMLIIKLAHFDIPLIARKSDGGYGYDSTDLTAIRYRLSTLDRDWVIYVTDEGQANHFHMCFDVARAVGWAKAEGSRPAIRLDHVGFGVVCGDDGKRLKTRSAEGNVRLIDLLEEARSRMLAALDERSKEGKNSMSEEDLAAASRIIGYGAVKYFDLKQHPSTNYIFNFDRMLDTKGDTAVYLMFAYARVTSILSKAEDTKNIIMSSIIESCFSNADFSKLDLQHPAEKALVFEIFQFGDILRSVLADLLPNRLCDYLKEVSVKFTDFVTRCHVLNAKDEGGDAETTMHSRLLLCEATRRIMETCFQLLGIGTLNRI